MVDFVHRRALGDVGFKTLEHHLLNKRQDQGKRRHAKETDSEVKDLHAH